jgi:hypothetical protein
VHLLLLNCVAHDSKDEDQNIHGVVVLPGPFLALLCRDYAWCK